MLAWDDIEKDTEFKALAKEDRQNVFVGWFEENIAHDPEFSSLPDEDQMQVYESMEKDYVPDTYAPTEPDQVSQGQTPVKAPPVGASYLDMVKYYETIQRASGASQEEIQAELTGLQSPFGGQVGTGQDAEYLKNLEAFRASQMAQGKTEEEISIEEQGIKPSLIDPVSVAVGAGTGALAAGASTTRAGVEASISGLMEYAIGSIVDEVDIKDERLTLPVSVALGFISGVTIEKALKQAILSKSGRSIDEDTFEDAVKLFTEKSKAGDTKGAVKSIISSLDVAEPYASDLIKKSMPGADMTALKYKLTDETGSVDLSKMIPGADKLADLDIGEEAHKVKKVFTRFLGLGPEARQAFINLEEGSEILKKESIKDMLSIVGDLDEGASNELYKHIQEPSVYPVPVGLESKADELDKLRKWSFYELNKRYLDDKDIPVFRSAVETDGPIPESIGKKLGYARFPDSMIAANTEELKKVQEKIAEKTEKMQEIYNSPRRPDWRVDFAKRKTATLKEKLSRRDLTPEQRASTEVAIERFAERLERYTRENLPKPYKILEEAVGELQAKEAETADMIERLQGVKYFHQITTPSTKSRISSWTGKTISSKQQGLLGRKFPTREDAIAAGRNVRSLQAATADMIYLTKKHVATNEFLDQVNKNTSFALPSNKAPSDWVNIDTRVLPSGRYRRYHPAVADAIKEVVYSPNKGALTRLWDKLNAIGKVTGMYNPAFMARYDISQGFRWAGFDFFKPSVVRESTKTFLEKGEEYDRLKLNGLFNSPFDMSPIVADTVDEIMDAARKVPTPIRDMVKKLLSPIELTKDTWKYLNESTWKIDEFMRINAYNAIKQDSDFSRKFSDFELIEKTNDFLANYNKVPKETKQTVGKLLYTPTYKISMARVLGLIHKQPVKYRKQLLRHYAMKLAFNFGVPAAIAGYAAVSGDKKRAHVEGYRVIVRDVGDDKETVYSISDPILEEAKIRNRPFERTLEYNLASIPNALQTYMRGKLFKKYRDEDSSIGDLADAYFKTGTPGLKELKEFKNEDREGFQKFMQLFGLAYIYKRNQKNLPEENGLKHFLKALDLWYEFNQRGAKEERE